MNRVLIHSIRVSDMATVFTNGKAGDSILLQLLDKLGSMKFHEIRLRLPYDIEMIRLGIERELNKHKMQSMEDNTYSSPSSLRLVKFKNDLKSFFHGKTGIVVKIFGPDEPELQLLSDYLLFRQNKKGHKKDEPRKFVFCGQANRLGAINITNLLFVKRKVWETKFLGAKWEYLYVIYGKESQNRRSLYLYPENHDFFGSDSELGILTYLKKSKIKVPAYSRKLLNIPSTFSSVVTQNPEFKKQIAKAKFYAELDGNILLLGKTGTGKELFANAIKNSGKRKDKPFRAVNCATFTEQLLKSELFGYKKGAFTGAEKDSDGLLKEVDGGILFMDEIGELGIGIQAMLLRALETKEFYKLGENKPIKSDFILISGTNREIEDPSVFRSDLYNRISQFKITLLPLKERGADDIKYLAEYFRKELLRDNADQVAEGTYFTSEALEAIGDFDWPGNVRQLSNFITKAIFEALFRLTYEETITLDSNGRLKIDESIINELLAEEVTGRTVDSFHGDAPSKSQSPETGSGYRDLFKVDHNRVKNLTEFLTEVEKAYFESAIKGGKDQKQIGKILGFKQNYVSRKLKEFGIAYKALKKEIE